MKTARTTPPKFLGHLFNVDELDRIGDHDETFLKLMIIKFAHQVSICTGGIKDAIRNEDWEKLKMVTHKNISTYTIMRSLDIVELLKYINNNVHKEEEHVRIKNFAELICKKNDCILIAAIDYLHALKKYKRIKQFEFHSA